MYKLGSHDIAALLKVLVLFSGFIDDEYLLDGLEGDILDAFAALSLDVLGCDAFLAEHALRLSLEGASLLGDCLQLLLGVLFVLIWQEHLVDGRSALIRHHYSSII